MKKWLPLLLSGAIGLGAVSMPVSVNAADGFKDVKADHWAKSAIESAASKGYFKGYADGTFKPNATLTRAEFAATLARLSKVDGVENPDHVFADLSGHWSEAEVNRAVSLGFIDPKDYPNGFKPNTPVTRFEIAKWMTSGLAAVDEDYKQALEDTKTTVIPVKEYFTPGIPESKAPYVAVAMGTKLLGGYPDGTFGLNSNATRAEASTILLRYESVSGKKADEFLGLTELRQVGTERTNMETISPFTTKPSSFNNVVEKSYTFRNNAGSLKLHNYIVVDSENFKNIESIYAPLFIDDKSYNSRLDEKGIYRAYIQITIYPKSKEFDLDHYMGGVRAGVVHGSRINNGNIAGKYGYLTLPNTDTKQFFIDQKDQDGGITVWVQRYLDSNNIGDQLVTDDNSFLSIKTKN
ncbi:S-layer homology domain-containing protein [Paenibacillus sp. D2_2]|uniref:S-layer homology domain-containing protein n=1 Tax=Paenibacillus sp. D2_2 TaxID=3073092 RepID=UPI002815C39B|nr:S-layer homology domain-containing protein [Paenibacillus sp. D2_2]WMT42555.1 S-layer homology domain-containing protein [Paenibacillus sp. D2_2]